MNRYRKHGNDDIGDIASYLVTKWKELLKQESDGKQISSSKAYDKGLTGDSLACESKVDHVNNKHEKSKHQTAEIKSKVCIAHKNQEFIFITLIPENTEGVFHSLFIPLSISPTVCAFMVIVFCTEE